MTKLKLRYKTRLNKHVMPDPVVTHVAHFIGSGEPLCGNWRHTEIAQKWLEQTTGAHKVLLTSSCTDALEMAALLAGLQPDDEVIMPSFTFSSTANAIALRGAVPVFIDIRPDTQNIDEALIERAITPRTRALCVVYYAGIACPMDKIMKIARKHKLFVIEDAAQCVGSTYQGKALGTWGDVGTYSFHDSKVLSSGEGGALLINRPRLAKRAEIMWEKGTNRSALLRGEVKKYTWVDIGSSYLMSDILASLLCAQIKDVPTLIAGRRKLWDAYQQAFEPLEQAGLLRRPHVPEGSLHNGHIYYVLVKSKREREALQKHLSAQKIEACFHYIPLHSAPAGRKYGRVGSKMDVTNKTSSTLLRLPLYPTLAAREQKRIIHALFSFWGRKP